MQFARTELNAVSSEFKTLSRQVKNLVNDNHMCIMLLVLLAVAYFVRANCSCKNPLPDVKRQLKSWLPNQNAEESQ